MIVPSQPSAHIIADSDCPRCYNPLSSDYDESVYCINCGFRRELDKPAERISLHHPIQLPKPKTKQARAVLKRCHHIDTMEADGEIWTALKRDRLSVDKAAARFNVSTSRIYAAIRRVCYD